MLTTEIWYCVEYSRKGEDDWYDFDSSLTSDGLDVLKLRLQGRLDDWFKRIPEQEGQWEFRYVRKELSTIVLECEQ